MRRKGEDLWDCMARNGWKQVSGPKSYGKISSVVPDGLTAVWEKGNKRWSYGIDFADRGPHPIARHVSKERYPRCCRPAHDFKPPRWWRVLRLYITPSGIAERRQSAVHRNNSAKVTEWLSMDLKAEILKVRHRLQHEAMANHQQPCA
jgi:hypothetical protein